MTISYYTRFVLIFALSLLLSAQTDLVLTQEPPTQGELTTAGEIVIDMESYVFSPAEVSVKADTPMTLILPNQSFLVPHNFLLDDPSGVRMFETDISSGETQSQTLILSEPGIYPFYCDKQLFFFPTHREEGMEGRFIVQ